MAKVSLGTFKPMTDEEIDEFQQMSLEDVELLRAAWQKYTKSRYADLIDAAQTEAVIDATTTDN